MDSGVPTLWSALWCEVSALWCEVSPLWCEVSALWFEGSHTFTLLSRRGIVSIYCCLAYTAS